MTRETAPTVADLQTQLATVSARLRAVEDIAFRPIKITINFPGWPNPRAWLRQWRADRAQRLTDRHIARARRKWRKLCKKAHRNPLTVTSAELDAAWAAFTGNDGWRPPKPLLVRLRAWWADRQERRERSRLWKLMAKADRGDVLLEHDASMRRQERRIRHAIDSWYGPERDALLEGRKAIVWAGRKARGE
jgi:hypothetical protein